MTFGQGGSSRCERLFLGWFQCRVWKLEQGWHAPSFLKRALKEPGYLPNSFSQTGEMPEQKGREVDALIDCPLHHKMITEVTIMRVVGVRELRDGLTKLLRERTPVLIMRRSKVAGVYVPLDDEDLNLELRRDMQLALARKIRASLRAKGLSEQDILDDFEATRKTRR